MRKLVVVTAICVAVALPAVALAVEGGEQPATATGQGPAAATGQQPAAATGEVTLVAHSLGDRVAVREVRRVLRAAHRRARPPKPPAPKPVAVPAHLQAIAECESGGDPTAIGGGGLYRGKYQFHVDTWRSVGGTGDPAAAPEAEQDRRAIILYERSGPGQWPVCGA